MGGGGGVAGQDVWGSLKRDTFHRNQYPGGEGHYLGGAAGGRIFGKELAVHFVDHAKVISCYHEDGGLDDFRHAATGFFQNDLDVLKSLPGLVFEVITDDLAGVKVVTGGAGDEDEVVGNDGLRESLAHAGGLGGVEVVMVGHLK